MVFKKLFSIFVIFVIILLIPFQVLADEGTVTVSDSSGGAVVAVSQDGAPLFVGGTGFNGSANITTNGSSPIVVAVSVSNNNYYPTINGTFAQTNTLPANTTNIQVVITKIPAPSISIALNASGGVSYEISNSSPISSFEIEIYENNSLKGKINSSSTSGTISSLSEGKSYSVAARVYGMGYASDYGPKSEAVTIPVSYSLLVKGTEGGTVNDVSDIYIPGAKISLSATASAGYAFLEWTTNAGGEFESSAARETTFTMPDKNVTVTATFVKTYKFVIMSSTGGKVWDVDGNYYEGQEIKVSAIPGDGYLFDSWVSSDGGKFVDSKAVETVFTMPSNATTVTASFKEASGQTNNPEPGNTDDTDDNDSGMFEIKTTVVGNGNIVINQNKAHEGQKITIRATAQAGYTFDCWTCEGGGSFADVNAAATTFSMPAGDVTITANFLKGDSSDSSNDDTPEEEGDKSKASNSLIIFIIITVVVVVAAIVGILLVMKERAKRREYAEEDELEDNNYFSNYNTNYEEDTVIFDYQQNTGEFVLAQDETDPTEAIQPPSGDTKKPWRQQRNRRNQYSDNIYKADDWDN
ncbi:MAG: InlB B-repeat-containing protein [Oscillospiraceae bacterium]|nr:InlB B-repeat-containing protein [Oscillospiraceae bacterium]